MTKAINNIVFVLKLKTSDKKKKKLKRIKQDKDEFPWERGILKTKTANRS